MTASTKLIEKVGSDRVRVSGDVSLGELYAELPGLELYVEPLSLRQPLAEFVALGGMGFGTVPVGTFAGQICRLEGVYEGIPYTYALGATPLYNTGYALQRIIEGPNGGLLTGRFEELTEMVVRARPRSGRSIEHTAGNAIALPPSGDNDAMFVNEAAARAMGLPGAGMVVAARTGGAGDAAWAKRFLLDAIPPGHEPFVALTQESGARTLQEAHHNRSGGGFFAAVKTHLGALVVASAPPEGIQGLADRAAGLKLTWRIGERPAARA